MKHTDLARDLPCGQRFARGVAILAARHGAGFTVELYDNSVVYAGGESTRVNDMETDELEALGWVWSLRVESWRFEL